MRHALSSCYRCNKLSAAQLSRLGFTPVRPRTTTAATKQSAEAMTPQLYFTPTSCGAASYIAAHKAGILGTKLDANLADIATKTVKSGPKKEQNFKDINPKGNVPALILDDGTLLNEGSAFLQWIADQNPDSHLAPPWGSNERYLLQSKLNYTSSEVHSSCSPLFSPQITDEDREKFVKKLRTKLDYLSQHELTGGKKYIVGDTFTVADSYLFIVLGWMPLLGIQLEDYPVLKEYVDHISSLDFVKEAHRAMNDIKAANP